MTALGVYIQRSEFKLLNFESTVPNLPPRRNALLRPSLLQIQICNKKTNKQNLPKVYILKCTSVKEDAHDLQKCNTAKSADFNFILSKANISY